MEKTITALKDEFAHIRTGRAYLIVIQPWDKNCLSEIEKAIWKSDLGLAPSIDGNIIRLTIPPLNEERRKELVKLVKNEAENGKISIRNVRREVNDLIKKEEKESNISEDECR
jgi:ribosome recycling factor